ncbi:LOW QUALITY PROTEIN: hypothetical protein PHMEG_00020501 [Phytophthora megakarya]|uniref:Uncharacterized protein n=1 Tax=Phytophthora megakarya TaxID=4795 RepID=A0A225VQS2_9STRA|nr:LOW QUALITY PROTEIN: hypothetical protein PHMEG_00020501 [Phytophthora megakarya]
MAEGSQLQDSHPASLEPGTPLASASHPQTLTPAPEVDSATCGVSDGCGASSGGLVERRGHATEPLSSSMCELVKLVVGMARQPPARINSYLDQRLDKVLTRAVAPHRLPPQEDDELVRLRDEVSRLQARCENFERDFANEVQLRTAAVADSLRTENEELVARIRELDITVAEQALGVQRLKDRCRSSDADCAAAMRFVAQERERVKAGLTVYNAELAKLRQYLEEHDRGKVCSATPRHLSNKFYAPAKLCHELNTDALILSTAGVSASGLDWELLSLGHGHTGLLRRLPPN